MINISSKRPPEHLEGQGKKPKIDGKTPDLRQRVIKESLEPFLILSLVDIVRGYDRPDEEVANEALDEIALRLDAPDATSWLDRSSLTTLVNSFRAVVTGVTQGGSAAKLWAGLQFKNELLAFSTVPDFLAHKDAAQLKPVGSVTTSTGYRNSFAQHGLIKPLARFEEALQGMIEREPPAAGDAHEVPK